MVLDEEEEEEEEEVVERGGGEAGCPGCVGFVRIARLDS